MIKQIKVKELTPGIVSEELLKQFDQLYYLKRKKMKRDMLKSLKDVEVGDQFQIDCNISIIFEIAK